MTVTGARAHPPAGSRAHASISEKFEQRLLGLNAAHRCNALLIPLDRVTADSHRPHSPGSSAAVSAGTAFVLALRQSSGRSAAHRSVIAFSAPIRNTSWMRHSFSSHSAQYVDLDRRLSVSWRHVRGHRPKKDTTDDARYNREVDALAVKARHGIVELESCQG
jgi:hypothetical protein